MSTRQDHFAESHYGTLNTSKFLSLRIPLQSHHLELILYQAYANLRAEAERTYIGVLWWIFDPIIFMSIFYIVFALLLRQKTDNFVAFLLVGLVIWRWFQNTVTNGSNAILNGQSLMRQVYLPKLIFPLVTILSDLFKFTLVFTLLVIYLWASGHSIGLPYLTLPFLLFVQFLLIMGTTCVTASLVPLLPDLRYLIGHLLQLMFYVSGIFYSGESIPEKYRAYFYLNPAANLIESYRDILLNNRWPDLRAMLIITLLALFLILIGYKLVTTFDHEYPKMVAR
ncbi:MAG: ABC transporter permease [Gammaproteobacteria bacterium]|nr:ABC transporter permease [Gammaproteobacteria bacterium]MCP5425704.1 ABC transporter permease [Gammaproteobacteria bacterium]